MQKSNQKLDTFISEFTSGEVLPLPETEDDDALTKRIWSGQIAEIAEDTYSVFMEEVAGKPKMMQDSWYIFSDARSITEPGILFWRKEGTYFARRLDQDEWGKFIKAARVKKVFW